jgi:phosphatidate cytidylyltransferase
MLRTRLWMGAVLILLVLGVLLLDSQLAPYYPVLFLLILVLTLLGCYELLALLGPRRPWPSLCYLAVTALISVNWLPHVCPWARTISPDPLRWVFGTYVAVVLIAFLAAMASFEPSGGSNPPGAEGPGGLHPTLASRTDTLSQVSLTLFTVTYLGVLPSFLAQLRWPIHARLEDLNQQAVLALTLAIFVPKCSDTGAYFTGRLLGRHKMAPVLSPKKTLEGLAGGLLLAAVAAWGFNRLGPVLPGNDLAAIGFGLTVGAAGVLGDLAESLIKRECRQKDASQVMPGFGGVLDVVDSIIYAAPVSYCWLA